MGQKKEMGEGVVFREVLSVLIEEFHCMLFSLRHHTIMFYGFYFHKTGIMYKHALHDHCAQPTTYISTSIIHEAVLM